MKEYLTKRNVLIAIFYAFEIVVVLLLSHILVKQVPEHVALGISRESAAAKAFLSFLSSYGTKEYEGISVAMASITIGGFLPLLYTLCWIYRFIGKLFFSSKNEKPQLS